MSREIDDAFEGASKLAGSNLPPADFYQQFLNRTLSAINAPAGAVWLRTPQGFLQLACQKDLEKVGLENKRGGRQCHNEVLRLVFQAQPPRPVMLEPNGRLGAAMPDAGGVPAANLSDYFALLAPIVAQDRQPLGVLEVFQEPSHDPRMYPTFLNYANQMAGYASQYHMFSTSRSSSGMEKTFAQIEAFARLIHGTLNPTEAAYHVANEGRKVIECDRLSVGVRHARKKVTVEAVSGADVVEKASTHVRRMRKLMEAVLKWGETLKFEGKKDEGLPPQVSYALDAYLVESQPKLLVVMPVRDEREKKKAAEGKPARSVLMLESFNPPEQTEPIVQRLEVVGKHAAPALYNAAEMKRIPLKFLWWPLAKVQEGLGGKARAITFAAVAVLAALVTAMILVPYPLRMDATGQMLPVELANIYPPRDGIVREIRQKPGEKMLPGSASVVLYSPELLAETVKLQNERDDARSREVGAQTALAKPNLSVQEELELRSKHELARLNVEQANRGLEDLHRLYRAVRGQPGWMQAEAPPFDVRLQRRAGASNWTVLNDDKKDQLLGRTVRPNEPLMRVGNLAGMWHVELKIPQRNVGQVRRAFADPKMYKLDERELDPATGKPKPYLDVDVLLSSMPDSKFLGRLYADGMAGEAVPNKDEHNENEPIVTAYVKLNLDDFPPEKRVPETQFVTGLEVRTRIRCGDHALGYSLFHGVWEWFYEKVVFWF